jgi:superfamily II DNA or RNA helicase
MLIADDVGIGKTVEACLVARELIDRGEVTRMSVLCPPHLAEQWQRALWEQFHIDAALVLSGTVARLERSCSQGESLFERFPFTVVSTDYIKQERRKHEFMRTCPELVIVDEAHTCAAAGGRSLAQRRHELLQDLTRDELRHLILVTATPHSGKSDAFRSLLTLLDPALAELPEDLSGEHNRRHREHLARHLVQRRRGDLKAYLDTVTPFPERDSEWTEAHYNLSPAYRKLFDRILGYCRESVLDETISKHRQRIRWWSALALLRSLGSSPAAAAATLRNRSVTAEADSVEQVDEQGRRAVLDLDEELPEGIDVIPGSDHGEDGERERLVRLAREVEKLTGKEDTKLQRATELVMQLIDDGFSPILFCRFIPTAEYVAEHLRRSLARKGVEVAAITGLQPPEERERRIEELGLEPRRVMVCTDCLSEGVNLQHHFDAVIHYDLSWNPTRHEQREGRVDRYGQPKKIVRALTFYGQNSPVDGIVLQVLLRKHQAIRKELGITVPVPMDTQVVEDAILEGLLLREEVHADQPQQLTFDFIEPIHRGLHLQWDTNAEREKRSRTLFAQHQLLKAVNTEVVKELNEVREALGGTEDVAAFTTTALATAGAAVSGESPLQIDLQSTSRALREAIGTEGRVSAVFEAPAPRGAQLLTRTHPLVEGLAAHVLETALDPELTGVGRRCGVIRTRDVKRRTTVLLLRMRFHIVNQGRDGVARPLLAEDHLLAGFSGSPDRAEWLPRAEVEPLLAAQPHANLLPEQARDHLNRVTDRFEAVRGKLDEIAEMRGQQLFDSHRRVRKATKTGVRSLKVDVHPPDVIGIYIYLPAGGLS